MNAEVTIWNLIENTNKLYSRKKLKKTYWKIIDMILFQRPKGQNVAMLTLKNILC